MYFCMESWGATVAESRPAYRTRQDATFEFNPQQNIDVWHAIHSKRTIVQSKYEDRKRGREYKPSWPRVQAIAAESTGHRGREYKPSRPSYASMAYDFKICVPTAFRRVALCALPCVLRSALLKHKVCVTCCALRALCNTQRSGARVPTPPRPGAL